MTRLGPRTLFVPLRAPATAWLGSAAVFVVYALTMARDIGFYDSPELALVSHEAGLGHPPGQPLYTMLGWLFQRLPLVPAPVGASLLSAAPAALSVLPAISLAEGLAGPPEPGARGRLSQRLIVATVAALMAHPALWEPSTRAEVYALATLSSLWAAARLAHAIPPADAPGRPEGSAWLAPGVALGLSACCHPWVPTLVALALAPAVGAAVLCRRVRWASFGRLALGGGLGLCPYGYLFLVATRPPEVFAWGTPRDAAGAWAYLSARDFAHNRAISAGGFVDHLAAWLGDAASSGQLAWLAAGATGFAVLGRASGAGRAFGAILVIGSVALVCSSAAYHPGIGDFQGYLAAASMVGAAGVAGLVGRGAQQPRTRGLAVAGALVALAVSSIAPPAMWTRARGADRVARTMATGLLEEAPAGAIVVAGADHWVAPLLYVTEVERQRPDVVVIATGLASSSWFWEHVFARHPDLARSDLSGPGGRPGRVRRLLNANPDRAVLLSSPDVVRMLSVPVCDVGFFAWTLEGERCPPGADAARASHALSAALAEVGRGAPPADEVLAAVALERGEMLWRLGRTADAVDALLAGVPSRLRPAWSPPRAALAALPPLRAPLPAWRRRVPLGEPGRPLLLAAELARAAGDEAGASLLRAAAAREGLPEASEP